MYLVSMFVLQVRSDILPLCRMKCHSWWERSTRTSLWRAGRSRWRRLFIKRSSRRWWGTRVQTCSTGSRETCTRPWRSAITHPSWWATCTSGSLNERSKGAAHSPAARRKTTPWVQHNMSLVTTSKHSITIFCDFSLHFCSFRVRWWKEGTWPWMKAAKASTNRPVMPQPNYTSCTRGWSTNAKPWAPSRTHHDLIKR